MSGIAAFFQAVREKWRHHPCPEADRRDLPSHHRAPVVRTARDDLDIWTDANLPPTGGADPELRINRMMRAFRVDRRELEQDYPRVLRDAEITCERCRSKRRCFRELEAGTAAAHADQFCPNADLLAIFADDRAGSLRV
jgi:hypothetical protein